MAAANQAGRVDALAGGCLLVQTETFRNLGGFSGEYIGSEYEDVDLSLRLADGGLELWYQPEAELYWLQRLAWPTLPSAPAARYNEWLFDHRWAKRIRDRESSSSVWLRRARSQALTNGDGVGPARPRGAAEVVEIRQADTGNSRLTAASLYEPKPSSEADPFAGTYSLAVEGWAATGKDSRFEVELLHQGEAIRRAPADIDRSDLDVAAAGDPGTEAVGFSLTIGSLDLPQEFTLEAEGVFADGERTPLAGIDGRRRRLQSGFTPKLQPLLVTTLGRTGSSWLMLLLGEHPEIAAYRPFQREPRVSSYWMEVLRALADPASYMQIIDPELYSGHWWLGDKRPSALQTQMSEPHMARWLGGQQVELLAGFCQSRIEDFYSEVIRVDSQTRDHRYFAEKCWPERYMPRVMHELYLGCKEIILVRDFRDMVCSIFGFNRKRGFASFGRENTDTDEEFIRELRTSAERIVESWHEREDSAYLLRYEDLITEPEKSLAGVFDYLGVESDQRTVARVRARATKTRRTPQRQHQTASSPTASVGRWKDELPATLVEVCDETFGDVLEELGYSVNGAAAAADREHSEDT